jgi:hypothetical protein
MLEPFQEPDLPMTSLPPKTQPKAAKPKNTTHPKKAPTPLKGSTPAKGPTQRELFAVARKIKIPIGGEDPAAERRAAAIRRAETRQQIVQSAEPSLDLPFEAAGQTENADKISLGETAKTDTPAVRGPDAPDAPLTRDADSKPDQRHHMAAMLGPPSLLPEEDASAYHAIEAEFFDIICPRNIVEFTWVRELTDGVWEERRMTQAKAVSIKLGRRQGVEATVEAIKGPLPPNSVYTMPPALKASVAVMSGDAAATGDYANCAKKIGLTASDQLAAIYVARMGEQMKIQAAIDTIRRNRARLLRDIENRRNDMAKLVKTASERLLGASRGADPGSTGEHNA